MKILSKQPAAFLKNLTKAYTEGIYADTPANRKLGRVGMSYAKYKEKIEAGTQDNIKSWDKDNTFYKEGTDESKLLNFWHRYKKTGDYAYVNKFQKVMEKKFPKVASWKMGSPNAESHQITAMSENGKRIAVLNLEDYSNIPDIQTFMDKCDAYQGGNVEDFEYPKIIEATSTLKNLKGSQLDNIIAYSNSAEGVEGIKVKKEATDAEKREAIAEFYYEEYAIDEDIKENAKYLDEIVNDALEDYVPEKEEKKKIPLSSISVLGKEYYKFNNGKYPKGRGNWAFQIGEDDTDKDPSKIFWHEGMFEDAVKKAKEEAQKRGDVYSIRILT